MMQRQWVGGFILYETNSFEFNVHNGDVGHPHEFFTLGSSQIGRGVGATVLLVTDVTDCFDQHDSILAGA